MSTNAFAILLSCWIACESSGNAYAVRDDCCGILQIRPCMVAELNRRAGYARWPLEARWIPEASKAMALEWISFTKPVNEKDATLKWYSGNRGSRHPGPLARNHWRKVRKQLKGER